MQVVAERSLARYVQVSSSAIARLGHMKSGGAVWVYKLCARISNAAGETAAALERRLWTCTDSARTSANINDLLLATPLSDGIYISGALCALPTSRQQSGPFQRGRVGATVTFSDS